MPRTRASSKRSKIDPIQVLLDLDSFDFQSEFLRRRTTEATLDKLLEDKFAELQRMIMCKKPVTTRNQAYKQLILGRANYIEAQAVDEDDVTAWGCIETDPGEDEYRISDFKKFQIGKFLSFRHRFQSIKIMENTSLVKRSLESLLENCQVRELEICCQADEGLLTQASYRQESSLKRLVFRQTSWSRTQDDRTPGLCANFIGRCLTEHGSLEELEMRALPQDPACRNTILEAIRNSPSLRVLKLGKLPHNLTGIARSIRENQSLTHLDLERCVKVLPIYHAALLERERPIKLINKDVMLVDSFASTVEPEHLQATRILSFMRSDLWDGQFSFILTSGLFEAWFPTQEEYAQFLQLLKTSKCTLSVAFFGRDCEEWNLQRFQLLVDAVCERNSVEELFFRWPIPDEWNSYLTSRLASIQVKSVVLKRRLVCTNDFLISALKQNVYITLLRWPSGEPFPRDANYYIILNRGGRRILKDPTTFHASLWPLVLERAARPDNVISTMSFDIINCLLRGSVGLVSSPFSYRT